jgi:hypothetical protein
MKKYLFEFIAIFIGVVAGFAVDDWRERQNEIDETQKALKLIQQDLQRDTMLYNLRIEKIIKPKIEYLTLGFKEQLSVEEFKKLHKSLRSGSEHKVYSFGYNYLVNNVTYPRVKADSVLKWIGYYYELSGPDGNYGRWNAEYREIVGDNYYKLFEVFPDFYHSDTAVSNTEIRKQLPVFLNDSYWRGRIRLTHREATGILLPIFEKNRAFASDILKMLESELPAEQPESI